MPDLIQAIILGVVQGVTEFIPISSDGHLVIVPWLLHLDQPSLLFDTVAHWGTLLAILLVFWRDLWAIAVATLTSLARRSLADPNARLGWYIVVGSIPVALAGLLLKDFIEGMYASPLIAGGFLLVNAAVLAGGELLAQQRIPTDTITTMTWRQAITIGLAQIIALAPGLSRSGSTIAAGLGTGLRRADAARFSFLLGTPAFLGAGLLQMGDTLASDPATVAAQAPMLVVGFIVAAIVGFVAIQALLAYVRHHSLYLFAGYCVVVGLLVIGLALFGY